MIFCNRLKVKNQQEGSLFFFHNCQLHVDRFAIITELSILSVKYCRFILSSMQVINGLMERDDWQEAIKTPLAALPGGSGNALACALNYYAK